MMRRVFSSLANTGTASVSKAQPEKSAQERTGRFWDQNSEKKGLRTVRWGQVKRIKRHIAKRYSGTEHSMLVNADIDFIKRVSGRDSFERGISVGCGEANKELWLLKHGYVEHFDLFDLSSVRKQKCLERADELAVADRLAFYQKSPFDTSVRQEYDLSFWSDSLHHMSPMSEVLNWTRAALAVGGVFFFNEYVGPNRIQFDERTVRLANAIRALLPDEVFVREDGGAVSREVRNLSLQAVVEADPSESVESELIVSEAMRVFPGCQVQGLGGTIWFFALKGLLDVLQHDDHSDLLSELLRIDESLSNMGQNVMAVGCALKCTAE